MRKIIFMLAAMMTVSMTTVAAPNPSTPTMDIKVAPGQASLQRDVSYSFDFGAVQVGMTAYRSFQLTNSGDRNLYLQDVMVSGAEFSASGDCPRVLSPRSYCTFEVRFMPWTEGFKTGEMYISTNGGLVTLHFTGWANRY